MTETPEPLIEFGPDGTLIVTVSDRTVTLTASEAVIFLEQVFNTSGQSSVSRYGKPNQPKRKKKTAKARGR